MVWINDGRLKLFDGIGRLVDAHGVRQVDCISRLQKLNKGVSIRNGDAEKQKF